MLSQKNLISWQHALPFWLSFALIPLVWVAALGGGWWLVLPPLVTWYVFAALDGLLGLELGNADPHTPDTELRWYVWLTAAWVPLQAITLFTLLAYVAHSTHLNGWEKIGSFAGMGVISGTIGINYSHELMHQKSKAERRLGDILLAMVLYSHFRSEHLLVHHRYVGTPRDPVTARYNEGFHRFYPRVLKDCWHSAFEAEKAMLARKNRNWTDLSNPFFLYWGLQAVFLITAFLIGGLAGVGLFLVQAGIAIWQLEVINYIEHYGLTREHLGNGKYEHIKPHHSWNASHKATNWLLINLQRHSDHHYKPNRRFPLLQTYSEDEAPQLPYGYPIMSMAAMCPPLWKRIMNPKVRAWRRKHYPDIHDWHPYNKAENPKPR